MLGEDVDWLLDIALEMDPEDGKPWGRGHIRGRAEK